MCSYPPSLSQCEQGPWSACPGSGLSGPQVFLNPSFPVLGSPPRPLPCHPHLGTHTCAASTQDPGSPLEEKLFRATPDTPDPVQDPGHGAHRQLGHPAQFIPESGPRSQWGADSFQGGIFCAFLATLAFVGARQCPNSVGRPGTIGASTAVPPVGLRLPCGPAWAPHTQGCHTVPGCMSALLRPGQASLCTSSSLLVPPCRKTCKLLLVEGCRKTGDRDPAATAKAKGQKKPMRTGQAGEVVSMVTRNQGGAGQHWKRS